jgi:hypothetical protein
MQGKHFDKVGELSTAFGMHRPQYNTWTYYSLEHEALFLLGIDLAGCVGCWRNPRPPRVGRPREWNWGGPKAQNILDRSWTAFRASNMIQISVAGPCSTGHDEIIFFTDLL